MKEIREEMTANPETYLDHMEDGQDIDSHLSKIEKGGWGGEPEIAAISRIYNRPVEIWIPGSMGHPVTRREYPRAPNSIKLAYYQNNHYNALMKEDDPIKSQLSAKKASSLSPESVGSKSGVMFNDSKKEASSR